MAASEVAKPSKWSFSRSNPRAEAQKAIQSAGPAPLGGLGTPERAMQTATSRASTAVLRGYTERNERARLAVRPIYLVPGTWCSSSNTRSRQGRKKLQQSSRKSNVKDTSHDTTPYHYVRKYKSRFSIDIHTLTVLKFTDRVARENAVRLRFCIEPENGNLNFVYRRKQLLILMRASISILCSHVPFFDTDQPPTTGERCA